MVEIRRRVAVGLYKLTHTNNPYNQLYNVLDPLDTRYLDKRLAIRSQDEAFQLRNVER